MSQNGPGDVPAVVRRRGRRRGGGGSNQSAAAAENQRQVQTGHVRAPRATPPTPPPPQGDTKSDADLGRARHYEHTPHYRGDVRDTYKEQPLPRRQQISNASANRPGAAAGAVRGIHDERERVRAFVARARQFASDPNDRPANEADRVAIAKGLVVLRHQHEQALGRLAAEEHAQPRYSALPSEHKDHGILSGIGRVMSQIAGTGGRDAPHDATESNDQFEHDIQRVEKTGGPLDFAYRQELKPTLDATSKVLEQTNRLSSASAGAALAAAEHRNVLKGAAEGLIHNDKSYRQVAEKFGIHGPAAIILGTAGDIAFDPSTYLSFGLKAPATAIERAAAVKAARRLAPAIKRAAKAGDEEAQARLAAEYEHEVAAVRRKTAGMDETRGIQAGVRLPGGRTFTTKGRATAAVGRRLTRATAKVQESPAAAAVNEVLRAFAPHVREPGIRPAEQAARIATRRETGAIAHRFAREGRQLGKFIQRAAEGDVERVRQIVDAVESGTVHELPEPLRAAAERMMAFHERVADAFEREGLAPPSLHDTVLASKDVQEALGVARDVLDRRVGTAATRLERADHAAEVTTAEGNAARTAAANAKTTDAAVDLAGAESLAERVGSREHPLTHAEEQELVDRLGGVVERLRQDAHTNIARTRTNDELGAIRRGDLKGQEEVRKALQEEDFYRKRARDQRAAGNRTAARASEAKARAARAVIKAHRAEVEPQHLAAVQEEGGHVLQGRAGALERLLGQLQERVAYEPPAGYVPRQTQAAMNAEAEGKPLLVPAHPQGKAGAELERLERRQAATVRDEKPDYLSDELPRIEAKYGIKMGRRLASAALWRRMVQRFARPVTGEFPIEGDQVLYRLEGGVPKRIDPRDHEANVQAVAEAALAHGLGQDAGIFAVPQQIDAEMTERLQVGGTKTRVGAAYDRGLRAFKAANTILRPGFFATTIAGNTWQQFLADASPRDMLDAWQHFAYLRKATLDATNPAAAFRKAALDWASGDRTYVVDGRAVKFSDLYEEAIDAGVVRTGSRIGDPTELTLEQQAKRRLGTGAGAKAAQLNEWLGEVAEDLDDMTKAMIYVQSRTKLGMSPTQAAERTFTKMIDYSDLSKAERTVFKRVMPFYVYTARNLPIQVKSILARPGKLANFEKVRQMLAELAGLPSDWQTQRTEAEQERMPFAIPGVTSHGFQAFLDPRLPVADIAAPAQLAEGPGGGVRMLERYGSGVAPPVKVPLELLLFKRRLDYDRPIDVPGSPPAAGALLQHIPGATEKGTFVQPATGQRYVGAKPAVDYLLRTLGGSPGSVVASVGANVPDRSNLDPKARALASFGGGFGVSASDPLYAVLDALRTATEKRYAKRGELKGRGQRDSAADIRNEDAIDALNNAKAKIQATIGFPDALAKARSGQLERDRLEQDTREPAAIRAERRRLESLRRLYGG